MQLQKKESNVIAVIIIAIVLGYALSQGKESDTSQVTSAVSSDKTAETKPSIFRFSASSMKNSLENGGYVVRTDRLKTLNAYVAEYQSGKMLVRFDIYHNRDNDQIEWVEIYLDATAYINLNNPDAPPNAKVVEATTKVASEAFKFPFFNKDSEEAKKLSQWVDGNVSKAIKQGMVIETKIGDLYFTMYGAPYMRFLEISATSRE